MISSIFGAIKLSNGIEISYTTLVSLSILTNTLSLRLMLVQSLGISAASDRIVGNTVGTNIITQAKLRTTDINLGIKPFFT